MPSILENALHRLQLTRCCPPPAAVTGVTTQPGGGSGEVVVTWPPLPPSSGVAFYRVYERKDVGTYWLVAIVTDDALGTLEPGRLGIVDAADFWPWPSGGAAQRCYRVTAVSTHGLEGPMSAEVCN